MRCWRCTTRDNAGDSLPGLGRRLGRSGAAAHLSLPLIGEGEVFYQGDRMPAAARWSGPASGRSSLQPRKASLHQRHAGLDGHRHRRPARHRPAVRGGRDLGRVDAGRRPRQRWAVRSAHACRPRPAWPDRLRRRLPALAVGSDIRKSHLENDDRVQDPYCLRCQPQVMAPAGPDALCGRRAGARGQRRHRQPLVFEHELIAGGNFHAEPVALAADALAIAIAEIGAITERRIAMLVDPWCLACRRSHPRAGLNSGFMIVHVPPPRWRRRTSRWPTRPASTPADVGQPGRPCEHGHLRGAPPLADAANTAHIVAIELLARLRASSSCARSPLAGARRCAAPGPQRLAGNDAGP